MATVCVRYYAGAAAAAGRAEEDAEASTVADLVTSLTARHGATLAGVIGVCSMLVDGLVVRDEQQPLADGSVVEVLPPFSGG